MSDLSTKEVPANFVPAAAVKRGGQALFVFTGRKGLVGSLLLVNMTFHNLFVFFVFL